MAKSAAPKKKTKLEQSPIIRATGRRKRAIALVRLSAGEGAIVVNGKDYKIYFPFFELQKSVEAPLTLTDTRASFDVSVKVSGGGVRGQAESIRHGIARALLAQNIDLKKTLRSEGFLTRDSRIKERKKPGLKRARRAPHFSKR
jgi:small subunit ribosomal protein S9